jgi:hypothetical protein
MLYLQTHLKMAEYYADAYVKDPDILHKEINTLEDFYYLMAL